MSGDDSTRAAIMDATFRALAKHGYADLTVQAIADEFEKSKSLIHYHYDSKADLMVAFLSHLLDEFIDEVEGGGPDDPRERLHRMAEIVVVGLGDDAATRDFHTALLGMRAQAPFEPDLQDQLVENDRLIRGVIADIVREGVESGEFREVDPERYAALFRSAIEGAQSHDVILGDAAPTDEAFAGIERYLIGDLLMASEDRPASSRSSDGADDGGA
ncbi:TetR/AcrR family transcriptional regulator [Halosimplex litoreum]|uniref:TetR/AcrR family transcriptional regulator n=1 Tax=Halosimplex litoreum TaxID=1198301 RepID=A0A7U3WB22_9EURY|nr:TetR/AcrR family transcriptional regulator [Halosimplex litoreum]QPV64817.1 TetR/AcrR family transcriptional regulator [Halosimplex litoreum]